MKFNGTLLKMSVVGTPNKEIADTRDISLTLTTADINVTTRDSGGWEEILGGVRSFAGKVTGVVDLATVSGKAKYADLVAYGIARSLVNLVFATNAVGDASYTGSALFTNVGLSAGHEGEVTWTADVKGSGALVPAVVA